MYQTLQGSRNWTAGGPTEIIYSEKIKWLDENDVFDEDERDEHLSVISQLDGAYLEYCAKKVENKK